MHGQLDTCHVPFELLYKFSMANRTTIDTQNMDNQVNILSAMLGR